MISSSPASPSPSLLCPVDKLWISWFIHQHILRVRTISHPPLHSLARPLDANKRCLPLVLLLRSLNAPGCSDLVNNALIPCLHVTRIAMATIASVCEWVRGHFLNLYSPWLIQLELPPPHSWWKPSQRLSHSGPLRWMKMDRQGNYCVCLTQLRNYYHKISLSGDLKSDSLWTAAATTTPEELLRSHHFPLGPTLF